MKTTKKGFTLIELIVVIAIIGVLAAILVPTMLGYVKKSKISSANSSASSVYKAINSALTELDEEGVDVGGLWVMTWNSTVWSSGSKLGEGGGTEGGGTEGGDSSTTNSLSSSVGTNGRFDKKVKNFFEDITKIKEAKAAIKGGSCVALAVASDTTYTGTYPGGIVTTDTYEAYSANVSLALNHALQVAGGRKTKGPSNDKDKKGEMEFTGEAISGDYSTLAGAVTSKK